MTHPIESLYIHVPFCAKKCGYCAFYSRAGDGAMMDRYVSALIREMEMVAGDLKPGTIFFGGGTPSILTVRQWERILTAMDRLQLKGAVEWTVESNPATVSLDKARLLRAGGVNRMSMGVQSLDPRMLERLGRVHSREMVFKSFDTLREAGFENLSLDVMFAIPGQTMETFDRTLSEILALGCEHVSCYELTYEEDTAFFEQLQAGQCAENEDLACAMYERLMERVMAAGFEQYEISNFARKTPGETGELPGFACRHNVNYWRGGFFHGLGPSAAGFVRGVRTRNIANTARYCEQLERGERAIESQEELSPLASAGELAAFGLRMNRGWPLALFHERTHFDLRIEWAREIDQLVSLGYARLEPDRFHLTTRGLRYADWAAELFLRS
jgi:oxygen-independent coproporphyrinogen-3 oxidase